MSRFNRYESRQFYTDKVNSYRVKTGGFFHLLAGVLLCGIVPLLQAANWNNPHSEVGAGERVLYSSFSGRPKHLDPARSYSSDEWTFIGQIYEPPLQYHYLKRPYQLEPLAAAVMPTVTYLDEAGNPLSEDAAIEEIAYSIYEIKLRDDIRYQPHPPL